MIPNPESSMLRLRRASQDFMLVGITMAAILLLVGTGTSWLHTLMGVAAFVGESRAATSATLLLNIALILFGWRRLRDLREEVRRRSAAEAEAWELAHRDPLTGFHNRRSLASDGEAALQQWRSSGLVPAALVIDLDGFKSVNDLFGHSAGDQVLASTAQRIQTCCPDGVILARTGGDEFVVVMAIPPLSPVMDDLGHELINVLSQSIALGQQMVATSASIGGAFSSDPEITLEALIKQADTAMYRAKKLGRCRYERFDDLMGAALIRRNVIERELRRALELDEVYPMYQPVVDLSTGRPVSYEMLARWNSPTLGDVTPDEFINVAETAGLINALSERLYQHAMADALHWPTELSLSINVSPLQLRDPWFAQKLLKLIAETGFPPQRLIIELTESAIVDNITAAQVVFASLRNQGIRIALDDFGTGYSSVASLRDLPFDSIKLDRDFVTRIDKDGDRQGVAEAVLHLGQSLGLPVIAEGIETTGVAERLTVLSCAFGQGHYFSAAVSQSDLLESLNAAPPQAEAKKSAS